MNHTVIIPKTMDFGQDLQISTNLQFFLRLNNLKLFRDYRFVIDFNNHIYHFEQYHHAEMFANKFSGTIQ